MSRYLALITTNLITLGFTYLCVHNPECSKEKILEVYSSNHDLLHINVTNNQVAYEGNEDVESFDSFEHMRDWVSSITAKGTIPSGYSDDIQFYIDEGFITANIHPEINKKGEVVNPIGKVELYYSGPNWTNDSTQDTTYLMSTFNGVEDYNVEYDEWLENTYVMYVAYGKR